MRSGRFGSTAVGRCFSDSVNQGQQVIRAGFRRPGRERKPKHFPSAGDRKVLGMGSAQVIGVGFRVGRKRPQHRGGIGVHVSQRCHSSTLAR